jgi:hypothetical protein
MKKTISIKDVKVGDEFWHNAIKYKKVSLTSFGNVICCAAENLTSFKVQVFNPDYKVFIDSKLTFADLKIGQKFTINNIEYIKGEDLVGNPKAISIPYYTVYDCSSNIQVELVK